jgi:hypothetical protein
VRSFRENIDTRRGSGGRGGGGRASAATPVSVVVHGDLVYVLNALNGGPVQGYRVFGPRI